MNVFEYTPKRTTLPLILDKLQNPKNVFDALRDGTVIAHGNHSNEFDLVEANPDAFCDANGIPIPRDQEIPSRYWTIGRYDREQNALVVELTTTSGANFFDIYERISLDTGVVGASTVQCRTADTRIDDVIRRVCSREKSSAWKDWLALYEYIQNIDTQAADEKEVTVVQSLDVRFLNHTNREKACLTWGGDDGTARKSLNFRTFSNKRSDIRKS